MPRNGASLGSTAIARYPVEHMFVFGIDPGLTRTGYGIIDASGSTERAVAAGVIRTDPANRWSAIRRVGPRPARDRGRVRATGCGHRAGLREPQPADGDGGRPCFRDRAARLVGSQARDGRVHAVRRQDGIVRVGAADKQQMQRVVALRLGPPERPQPRRCGRCARRRHVSPSAPHPEREDLMIGRLRGTLASVHGETVIIDVGGVGYEVAVTSRTSWNSRRSEPRSCCTPTSTCGKTRWRCTASRRRTSGTSSACCSARPVSARSSAWRSWRPCRR